jgi:hypothetical protein
MRINEKSNGYLTQVTSLSCAIVFFLSFIYLHSSIKKPPIHVTAQDSIKTLNTTFLKIMSAGHKRLLSGNIWILTLLESDLEHYKKKDLNNWMYLRFSQISELDPRFYENYLYGGLYLSIVKDDPKAGSIIYDKGLILYPTDYALLYNAGFNSYFELSDAQRGLFYLERLKDHPRLPQSMRSVIAKLKLQTTLDYETAFEMVKENYNNTKDSVIREKLHKDMYAIKAEKDLTCLKAGSGNCNQTDLEGRRYIYRNGEFTTIKPFTPFRVKLRKESK